MITKYLIAGVTLLNTLQAEAQQKKELMIALENEKKKHAKLSDFE
jgi:hypothetical protein